MQILKIDRAQASVVDNKAETRPLGDGVTPENQEEVDGFFGADAEPANPSANLSPFAILSQNMPGHSAASNNDFRAPHVPTLQDILLAHPEWRFKLKMLIIPAFDKGFDKFEKRIQDLQKVLKSSELLPQERMVLQELVQKYKEAKAKTVIEKEKAVEMQAKLTNQYREELVYRADLNLDRFIGDPADLESGKAFKVAKDSFGKEIILDKDNKPIFDPVYDENYMPALASAQNLALIAREDRENQAIVHKEKSAKHIDEVLQLKPAADAGFPDNPLGAQIHIVPPEGAWFLADDGSKPKIITDKVTGEKRLIAKKMELVTREDGKQMWGQKPPEADERSKWVFVRFNELEINTQPLDATAPNENGIEQDLDGGNVHFEFKVKVDGQEMVGWRIAVQGYQAQSGSLKNDQGNWVMASSAGVAISSGKTDEGEYTEHSSRIRHLKVDASGLETTSKILPFDISDLPQRQDFPNDAAFLRSYQSALADKCNVFYEKYFEDGVRPFDDEGNFNGATERSVGVEETTDVQRGNMAANFTLRDGWFSTLPKSHLKMIKEQLNAMRGAPPNTLAEVRSVEQKSQEENAQEIQNRFGGAAIQTRQAYLPPKLNEFKTGLISIDIAGHIIGTKQSDFIVTGIREIDQVKKFMPVGTEDIPPHHAAYSTVVDGNDGGRDILISRGGDLNAMNQTFVYRTSEGSRDGNAIHITVKNPENFENQSYYLDIRDSDPEIVKIHTPPEEGKEFSALNWGNSDQGKKMAELLTKIGGLPDDWIAGPASSKFEVSTRQNDTIGLSITEDGPGVVEAIEKSATEFDAFITQDRTALADGIDMGGWDIPEWIKAEDENQGEFFEEYSSFVGEKDDEWDQFMQQMDR